jgi:KDEL-tailed cysteine endopeptidase
VSTGLLHQTLSSTPEPFPYEHVEPPVSVDWRTLGAVTPIKDQSQCGSCWAFSTTGSVEGAHAVTNQQLVSLSEQELLDCDRAGGDRGCSGGLMDYAFDFIIKNGGLDTESDYPYHASDGACDAAKRDGSKAVVVKSFVDVPPNNESALMQAVAMQPVAVALAASGLPFQLYKSGVFDGPCSTQLDHGMLAVGFGVDAESGKPYWLLKNSWGTVWGEAGYMKLAMGAPGAEGLCGVAMLPSFPLVDKAKPGPPPGPRPGPGPAPSIICDARTTCPANSTCCCTLSVFGHCLIKGCCPFPQATCCDDTTHCCPSTHPVCDLDAGVCSGDGGAVHALGTKFAATTEWLPFGRAQKGNEGAAASVSVAH